MPPALGKESDTGHIAAPGKPDILRDRFGRTLDYLRLAITDRCNLRCSYCMPEEGLLSKGHGNILRYEEYDRLIGILVGLGLRKVRITGGEPLARKGAAEFIQQLHARGDLGALHLTTNGVWSDEQRQIMTQLPLDGINMSLDSLRRERFAAICRRDELPRVLETMEAILAASIPLKLNAVIQRGVNEDEIPDLARLAEDRPLDLRFIEQMPFNGGVFGSGDPIRAETIESVLYQTFPGIYKLKDEISSTAGLYQIPGYQGRVGIIAAWSRHFCGGCNRLRITADGKLQTCLYGGTAVDLRALLRGGASDQTLANAFRTAVAGRAKDGFEAEARTGIEGGRESMAAIGG